MEWRGNDYKITDHYVNVVYSLNLNRLL
jgi:hypothetical protein